MHNRKVIGTGIIRRDSFITFGVEERQQSILKDMLIEVWQVYTLLLSFQVSMKLSWRTDLVKVWKICDVLLADIFSVSYH